MTGKTYNRVLVDATKLKRIRITCRCGTKVVEEVPGEVLDTKMMVIIECPNCHQHYTMAGNKLIRLDKEMMPEKILSDKLSVQSAQAPESEEDEITRLMETLRKQGTVISPSDFRKIN